MRNILSVVIAVFSFTQVFAQFATWTSTCQGAYASSTAPDITSNPMAIVHDCNIACFFGGEGAVQGDEQFESIPDDQSFTFGINNNSTTHDAVMTGLSYRIERSFTGFRKYEIELFINGISSGVIVSEVYTGTFEVNRNISFTDTIPPGYFATFVVTISDYQGDVSLLCNTPNNNGTFRFLKPIISGNFMLPVELIKFTAEKRQEKTILQWQTTTETNNDYFQVEHTTNGKDFKSIGIKTGAGTTVEPQSYSFIHENPSPGFNYYRLKQVDFDGAFAYSKVVSVQFGEATDWEIYPTAAKENVTVQWSNELFPQAVSIFDMHGKLLLHQEVNTEGQQKIISTANLPAGNYVLKVQSVQSVLAKRFVKM